MPRRFNVAIRITPWILTLLAFGCGAPVAFDADALDPDTLVAADEPNVALQPHWIRADEETLVRYAWPQRGQAGEWTAVASSDADWFVGDGWYVFAPDAGWRRDASLDDLTLDDALQVYDPAPLPE